MGGMGHRLQSWLAAHTPPRPPGLILTEVGKLSRGLTYLRDDFSPAVLFSMLLFRVSPARVPSPPEFQSVEFRKPVRDQPRKGTPAHVSGWLPLPCLQTQLGRRTDS